MGLNQSIQGTWNSNALCNLHLATGAICRPGSGPFSLTGQPNAMGGREVGALATMLAGHLRFDVPAEHAARSSRKPHCSLRTGGTAHGPAHGERYYCYYI